jgi:hypothetical protein
MKVFSSGGRVNFVDEADTFVGFDYMGSCCESFGWMLSSERPAAFSEGDNGIEPAGFLFDRDFFEDTVPKAECVEEGGVATFRLTKDTAEIFLTLWNAQNGYYGHGFEVKHGGTVVKTGSL